MSITKHPPVASVVDYIDVNKLPESSKLPTFGDLSKYAMLDDYDEIYKNAKLK